MRAQYHVFPEKRMAEPEQKQLNGAITDGQQPVADEAGGLVPGGAPAPADVVSAPGPTRDPRGKFAAGGTRRKLRRSISDSKRSIVSMIHCVTH